MRLFLILKTTNNFIRKYYTLPYCFVIISMLDRNLIGEYIMSKFDSIFKQIINEYGDDTEKLKGETDKAKQKLKITKVNRAKAIDTPDADDDGEAETAEIGAEAEVVGAEEKQAEAELTNVKNKAEGLRKRMSR